MPPSDLAQVLTAVADIDKSLNKSMNDGFGEVYRKIDEKFDECDDRLTIVETDMKVKSAVANVESKNKKEKRDFWKIIIRSWIIISGISLFGIAIKLIIFGSKL